MATILYIDHKETAQQVVQSLLGPEDNLVSASDGSTAIQYCAMLQPDLILINLALPDIDAHELTARLKMFMPQTPILALTASVPELVAARSRPAKVASAPPSYVDVVLDSPLRPDDLLAHIRALIPPSLPAGALPDEATRQVDVNRFAAQIAALNQANRRLASLNAVSALIGASLDLEDLMDEILAQIHKTIDFDSATLFLLKGDVLEAAASRGLSGYRQGMNTYPKSAQNSAWQVVNNKLPLIIGDVTHSPYWEPRPELAQIRSWMGAPLIYKDRVVGVLTLDKNEPDAFSDADARYLFTLAYQIAIAVENAQLFQEWEKQAARLKLINEVAREINTLLDVEELFDALTRVIFERLNYAWVSIWEVDETRSFVALRAMDGSLSPSLVGGQSQQKIEAGLIGYTVATGLTLRINNLSESEYPLLIDDLPVKSALTAPLFVGAQIEAVICAASEQVNGFSDHDVWTLSSLASQAGVAIKNAWLYRGLDTYSDTLERTIAARNQRLQAIKKISQVVSQGLDIDELMAVVRRDIRQIFTSDSVEDVTVNIGLMNGSQIVLNQEMTSLLTPDSLAEQVIRQATPKLLRHISVSDLYNTVFDGEAVQVINSVLMTPLITAGKTIGFISVESQTVNAFDDSDLETLETIAYQVASAIEHARLLQKTREIAIVEERTRLARDMHDGIAQNLAYLLIQVERGLNMVEEGSKIEAHLEKIGALLRQNIDELRRNIFDLRPVALEGKSIFEALEKFVLEFGRRWNIRTSCTRQGSPVELRPEVESALYRILQEALSNAQQHAQCRTISVQLGTAAQGWVTLEVRDDGQGFDPDRLQQTAQTGRRKGLGLISMQERVYNVGGELTIESQPGQGTRVFAMLPAQ